MRVFLPHSLNLLLAIQLWPGANLALHHADVTQLVPYFAQTLSVVEAENFTSTSPAGESCWQAREWAHSPNYFASVVSNVFHSRRAYLHAPANASSAATAVATLSIDRPGNYTPLARFEAPFGYEVPFTLELLDSTGQRLLKHTFGLRTSLKVWGFGKARSGGHVGYDSRTGVAPGCASGLNAECKWPWGATENMVWQGAPPVELQAQAYTLKLSVATGWSEGSAAADRNVDTILFTPNATDLDTRMKWEGTVLPFDGLLSQAGEVFFNVTALGENGYNLSIPRVVGHSPYYDQHLVQPMRALDKEGNFTVSSGCTHRQTCQVIAVPAGSSSGWVDVGANMDVFNHGTWDLPPGNYTLAVGVKADGSTGRSTSSEDQDVEQIGFFDASGTLDSECIPAGVVISPSYGPKAHPCSLQLLFDASTRSTRRMRNQTDDFWEIKETLDKQVVTGRVPQHVPVYAEFFSDTIPSGGSSSADSRCPRCSPDVYGPAQQEMKAMYAVRDYTPSCSNNQSMLIWRNLASSSTYKAQIETAAAMMANGTFEGCAPGADCSTCDLRQKITSISLGDELRVGPFRWTDVNDTSKLFVEWLQQNNVTSPSMLGCSSWAACTYWNEPFPNASIMSADPTVPARWYYSQRFMHDAGISQFKEVTDTLRKHLPSVRVGMNQSPVTPPTIATYTGNPVHSMIRCFRESCLDLPWSEDWVWQAPLGSQQMFTLTVDAMRAGMTRYPNKTKTTGSVYTYRTHPARRVPYLPSAPGSPMMLYVMGHFPGNTPASFRRQFYGDLSHGMNQVNLFVLKTSFAATTCDYIDVDGGTWTAHRQVLNEFGMMDDIVAKGAAQAQGAAACILHSETDDIWFNGLQFGPAAKRTLYLALRHSQLAVDIVIEEDCQAGHLQHYSVLYIVDPHVSERAMTAISDWVKTGGIAYIEAGGAALNEFNETGHARATLAPFDSLGMWTGGPADNINRSIMFSKQDLPFAEALDSSTAVAAWNHHDSTGPSSRISKQWHAPLGVYGQKEIVRMKSAATVGENQTIVVERFVDGTPSIMKTPVGHGVVVFSLFHLGFSYFKDALPKGQPADRGSTDQNNNHWVPTNFSRAAREIIASAAGARQQDGSAEQQPIFSSEPLVEAGLVYAPGLGAVIPLVDWSRNVGSGSTAVNITLNHRQLESLGLENFTARTMASTGAGVVASVDVASARTVLHVPHLVVGDAIIMRPKE